MPPRRCTDDDFEAIWRIIDAAAEAYRGVIPAECWHEPYMPREELAGEIADGVVFWGDEREGELVGVMGIQDRGEVTLIRHAYVSPEHRRAGVGSALLAHLHGLSTKPYLVGTWAAAGWAVDFYLKHGYRLLSEQERDRLLARFWNVSADHARGSVVLAGPGKAGKESGKGGKGVRRKRGQAEKGSKSLVSVETNDFGPFSLDRDAVFGVREALVVRLERHEDPADAPGDLAIGAALVTPFYRVDFDLRLVRAD